MNKTARDQVRHDLACEVLALGNDAPIDLETVLDAEMDGGVKFAEEAAAILAYDGETSNEYAFRVQEWLRGIISKHITDEQVEDYADQCDADLVTEQLVEERRAA